MLSLGCSRLFGRGVDTEDEEEEGEKKSCLLAPVFSLRKKKKNKVERLVCSGNQAEQMCLKLHMVLTITETAVFSLCHSSHTRAIRFLLPAHRVGGKIMPRSGGKRRTAN